MKDELTIYVVSTGAKRYHSFMREHGLRMLHLANDWRNPVDGIPYAIDNGAYSAWKQDKRLDIEAFTKALRKADESGVKPDFVVCPDAVAAGYESLKLSLLWAKKIPRDDYYLSVQDGMFPFRVSQSLDGFRGIFVGGTMFWKLRTGEHWVKFAHEHGLKCHIGRIGTERRLLWARWIGADSVDSSTFPQGPPDGRRFKRIFVVHSQQSLWENGVEEKP